VMMIILDSRFFLNLESLDWYCKEGTFFFLSFFLNLLKRLVYTLFKKKGFIYCLILEESGELVTGDLVVKRD